MADLQTPNRPVSSRTNAESKRLNVLVDTSHRGVWIAPWRGTKGELVLFAIDSHDQLVTAPLTIPIGSDRIAAADMLWDLIDEIDPQQPSFIGRAPRFRRLRRTGLRSRSELGLKIV